MRVVRGRAADPEADRRVTAELLARTAETGVPAVRAWAPHRQIAFGRRDATSPRYEAARAVAAERGYPPLERDVGGRAVAYGGSTLAFVHAIPIDDVRHGIAARYEAAAAAVLDALCELGAEVRRGEPPASFCPGTHSLRGGGKTVGIAQRVRRGAALVAGCVVVTDREGLASVLEAVYGALGVPFDPRSVGSVAAAGGPDDPCRVARAIERALVDGRETAVERLGAESGR